MWSFFNFAGWELNGSASGTPRTRSQKDTGGMFLVVWPKHLLFWRQGNSHLSPPASGGYGLVFGIMKRIEEYMERERQPLEHEGEKYLDMLGLGALVDQEFIGKDGATYQYRDFLDHCGPEARDALAGLDSIGTHDSRFETVRDALRQSVLQHINQRPSN
jgi:hypothetical protein